MLASDGIWEFLSNERVSDIVNIYYNVNNVETAVNTLIEEAIRCWIIVKIYKNRKMTLLTIYQL